LRIDTEVDGNQARRLRMHTPGRVESLEAGIHFLAWLLSDHTLPPGKPERFFSGLGLSWQGIVKECRDSDMTIAAFIESFEGRLPAEAAHVFPWFELGRRTVFIANLAGTGAPPGLHLQAMQGYGALLQKAGFDLEERVEIEALVRDVTEGSVEEEAAKLQKICDRLRRKASVLSPTRPDQVLWRVPWMAGVLGLCAVMIVGSLLLAAVQLLSPPALAIVVTVSLLAVGVLGAVQLQSDEGLSDEPFLKLMALSFAYLPFIRRRSESHEGS
jgi:hypothetical protein